MVLRIVFWLHNINNAVKKVKKVNVSEIGALIFFVMLNVEVKEVV